MVTCLATGCREEPTHRIDIHLRPPIGDALHDDEAVVLKTDAHVCPNHGTQARRQFRDPDMVYNLLRKCGCSALTIDHRRTHVELVPLEPQSA